MNAARHRDLPAWQLKSKERRYMCIFGLVHTNHCLRISCNRTTVATQLAQFSSGKKKKRLGRDDGDISTRKDSIKPVFVIKMCMPVTCPGVLTVETRS